MEDWLNRALSDASFGEGLDQFTLVIVSVDDEPGSDDRWVRANTRVLRFVDPFTSSPVRSLSVAAPLPPRVVLSARPDRLFAIVAEAIVAALAKRPARLPRGLDYDRCKRAIGHTLAIYETALA